VIHLGVDEQTIELACQTVNTLNEFLSGEQKSKDLAFDYKGNFPLHVIVNNTRLTVVMYFIFLIHVDIYIFK
jgi:hypothetical protein